MTFSDFTKRAKALFSQIKWSQEQLVNGMLIEYDGDSIGKDSVIYLVSPDGEKSPLPDGQYKTKSGCLFVLTDGKVSSVEDTNTNTSQPASKEPIKQAQSAVTPDTEAQSTTNMNSNTQTAEVKADAATEDLASDVATPAPDATQPDTSIQDALTAALAPINAALQQILSVIGGTTEMAKETKAELSKVKETVTKLAEEPAPERKAEKVITNPFASNVPKDIKESRTYQILNSTQKS
jgi:hypothetical protein